MLIIRRQRFAQQFAVHAHFAREHVGRLLQAQPRVAQAIVDLIAQQLFEVAQRAIFIAAEQEIQLPTTLTRLPKGRENAMGGEGAVVDAVDVITADGRALTAHLRDQLVEQATLADQRVVQRFQQRPVVGGPKCGVACGVSKVVDIRVRGYQATAWAPPLRVPTAHHGSADGTARQLIQSANV